LKVGQELFGDCQTVLVDVCFKTHSRPPRGGDAAKVVEAAMSYVNNPTVLHLRAMNIVF